MSLTEGGCMRHQIDALQFRRHSGTLCLGASHREQTTTDFVRLACFQCRACALEFEEPGSPPGVIVRIQVQLTLADYDDFGALASMPTSAGLHTLAFVLCSG